MSDEPEFTDEELALLAAEEALDAEGGLDAVTEQELEIADKPKRPRKRVDPPLTPVVAEVEPPSEVEATEGPYAGHPFAPPAQMDYGDPWGFLPVQMRHDADGNPA